MKLFKIVVGLALLLSLNGCVKDKVNKIEVKPLAPMKPYKPKPNVKPVTKLPPQNLVNPHKNIPKPKL